MKVKKSCPICNYPNVTIGHLCKECFSPLSISFERENNNRNIKMPAYKASKNDTHNNTPVEQKEFIPIPEVIQNSSNNQKENENINPGETARIINDIEQTLKKISDDGSVVKIQKSAKVEKSKIEKNIGKQLAKNDKIPQPKKETATSAKINEFKNKLKRKKKTSEENIVDEKYTVNSKNSKVQGSTEPKSTIETMKSENSEVKSKLQEMCNAILELENENSAKKVSANESENQQIHNENTDEIVIPDLIEDKYWIKWNNIKNSKLSTSVVSKKLLKKYSEPKILKKLAGYEHTIASNLGVSTFFDLPSEWQVEVRQKAIKDLGLALNEERAKDILRKTLVEAKLDELKKQPKQISTDFLQNGNWRWLGIAAILHMILVIAAFSIIIVQKPDEPLENILMLETEALVPEIKHTTIMDQPKVKIDPDEFPVDDLEEDFEPEFKNPEADEPVPDIPGEDFHLSNRHKLQADTKDPRPVISNPSAKIGAEGGKGGKEVGTDKPSGLSAHRQGSGKKNLLGKHGGNEKTENAVKLGLEWLAKQQHKDGYWVPKDSVTIGKVYLEGYTALALLCFLGAGHTDVSGDFKTTVWKGFQYLLKKQSISGAISSSQSGTMYNHSVATLALSEFYSMTGKEKLRTPIQKALDFIYSAQQPSGGWDYTPNKLSDRTDMSITGWVVMALQSAMSANIPIKGNCWRKAITAVNYLIMKNGEAYYSVNGDVYPFRRGISMIAVSLLIRIYAKVDYKDARMKASQSWLNDNLPSRKKLKGNSRRNQELQKDLPSDDDYFHSTYYWYYGTLATFMITKGVGYTWNRWNKALQKAVLSYQNKKGADKGSWDPEEDFWGAYAGRLYSTCMNILNMEIYYRHLPIYREKNTPMLFEEQIQTNGKKVEKPKIKPDASELLINSVKEAVRIINDPTRSESEKITALTYLTTKGNDDAFVELTNILWNKNVAEMIRWQVVLMLENYADDARAIAALIDAYKLPFNKDLRTAIIRTLGNMKRKRGLLFIANQLDTQETTISKAALTALEDATDSHFGEDKYAWLNWLHNSTQFE